MNLSLTHNLSCAREGIGDDLQRVANTNLDKGVELDALAKLPAPERTDRGPKVRIDAVPPSSSSRYACRWELYTYPVFYDVTPIRRDGVATPRWQLGSLPVSRGRLRVEEQYLKAFARTSRVAALLEGDPLPPMYDVQLLATLGDSLVLTGFEIVDLGGREGHYLQTWLAKPCHL